MDEQDPLFARPESRLEQEQSTDPANSGPQHVLPAGSRRHLRGRLWFGCRPEAINDGHQHATGNDENPQQYQSSSQTPVQEVPEGEKPCLNYGAPSAPTEQSQRKVLMINLGFLFCYARLQADTPPARSK